MSPAPLLLSVEEGAAQLRIGRSRMFDLIRHGEVLSVKVGGSRRIPYDSLRAYVDLTMICPPPDLPRASPSSPPEETPCPDRAATADRRASCAGPAAGQRS